MLWFNVVARPTPWAPGTPRDERRSARPFDGHRSDRLVFRGAECGVCIKRCPGGAITETKCLHYTYRTAPGAVREAYGVEVSGCGLCQTGVPCESRIPRAKET